MCSPAMILELGVRDSLHTQGKPSPHSVYTTRLILLISRAHRAVPFHITHDLQMTVQTVPPYILDYARLVSMQVQRYLYRP